jgi:hypothetical protein
VRRAPHSSRSRHEIPLQAAKPPLEPGTLAPVSTIGLRATSIKRRIGNAIVPFAPTGQRIPAQGANPGNRIPEKRCVLKEHRIGKTGIDIRGTRLCSVPSEREECCRVDPQGWHPGLVCDAPFRAWDSKHGGRAWYRSRGQRIVPEIGWGTGTGHAVGDWLH